MNVSRGIALGMSACRTGVLGEAAASPPCLFCEYRALLAFVLPPYSCQSGMQQQQQIH